MNALDHLSLEQEVVAELDPARIEINRNKAPTVRRETVLAMISRSAQMSMDFPELLNETGLLAASALEMEFFGYAQVRRTGTLSVGWGSVADSTHNVDPVPVDIVWDSMQSGFGYAIESGHPIIVTDSSNESRFRDPQLIDNKISTGIICPIIYREQRYGAVGVFTSARRALAKDDVLFLQSLTLLLGPTRAHQNTERTLAEHSRFLSSAIDSLDAMVVLLDAEGGIMQINRACQEWGGFTAGQLRGRKVWNSFFVAKEEEMVRATVNELRNGSGPRRCDAFFLTKQGDERRVSWTLARLPSTAGDATFLATGIDITEQFRAIAKLEAIELEHSEAEAAKAAAQSGNAAQDGEESESSGRDRRRHDRRPYSCVQSVAPCLQGKLPDRHHFREVRCHDISPRGFSFLMDTKPDFEELVAAFGSSQSQLFLRARVKHTTPFRFERKNMLLVGCEYSGRVRLPWVAEKSTP